MLLIKLICLAVVILSMQGCSRLTASSVYIDNLSGTDIDKLEILFVDNQVKFPGLLSGEHKFVQRIVNGSGLLSINYYIDTKYYQHPLNYVEPSFDKHCDIQIYVDKAVFDCFNGTAMDRLLKRKPKKPPVKIYAEFE